MTVKEILDASKEKMSKSVAVYQNEMTSLRAGRANPRLLDRIMVDYYGTPTPLPQIGNINVPEARMIVIKPWEKKMISAIEKAIQKSELGLNPTNDGEVVRLVFPDLNEERRKELTKMARKSAEGAKVAVRSIRRDAVEQIRRQAETVYEVAHAAQTGYEWLAGKVSLFLKLREELQKK